ncbi:MAG: carboxypeptidase regulatory-like domain-containing protein [Calditrichaeota bacterium]|nr:carboxypeptidase regulatory-like domain-containing protein [Calditrichota bacterium]
MHPGHHSGHALSGIVTGIYPPYAPLADAEVRLPTLRRTVGTDDNGHFRFESVPPGSYLLLAKKSGYRPDSLNVDVSEDTDPSPILFRLDALPRVENAKLTTTHISRWWPPDDLYILTATASIWDPDGPADLVATWLECETWGRIDTLAYQPARRAFAADVLESDLPTKSLVALEGHAFHILGSDRLGARTQSGPLYISRIIDFTPVIESPKGYTETSAQPWLRWRKADVPFPHTWSVEIIHIEGGLALPAWSASGLAQDSTRVQPSVPLSSGAYYWVLWIVDEWGNRSRSKEGAFKVP